MSKVIVRTPKGVNPIQINFANPKAKKDMKRSVKGAVHFGTNSTKTITKDELEYIEKFHKDFYKKLIVVYDPEALKKKKVKVATKVEVVEKPDAGKGKKSAKK